MLKANFLSTAPEGKLTAGFTEERIAPALAKVALQREIIARERNTGEFTRDEYVSGKARDITLIARARGMKLTRLEQVGDSQEVRSRDALGYAATRALPFLDQAQGERVS